MAIYGSITLANFASRALQKEAALTPKPGLVDKNNPGAHKDMDYELLVKSAKALFAGFLNLAEQAAKYTYDEARQLFVKNKSFLTLRATNIPIYPAKAFGLDPNLSLSIDYSEDNFEEELSAKDFFAMLRPIGVDAEAAMLEATQGVNTHKGAFFGLGLMISCAAALKNETSVDNICFLSAQLAQGIAEEESANLMHLNDHERLSLSEYNQQRLQRLLVFLAERGRKHDPSTISAEAMGARGLALQGYFYVRELALPFYNELLQQGSSQQEASLKTLLLLMAYLPDTNIIKRGGLAALKKLQTRAAEVLAEFSIAALEEFDEELIQQNLSPGGSADCLAFVYFLDNFCGF
ncbi:MAG: hypothetical protein GX138_01060 [Firmicutes bacterium]|jgi:triphosphoribosyl-dephospho-CoA synthase|nr:hypothetical protein [Bacillota bacterium]